jgi:ketosteroid isomerase-like protein
MTQIHDPIEEEVRESNEAFYRAFRDRDVRAMETIWASSAPVACAHPGMETIRGRDAVLESFRGILNHDDSPRILCTDVTVHVLGETVFVTCLEGVSGHPPSLVATNLFVREAGVFKLVLHHAGPLSARSRHEPLGAPPAPATFN